MFPGPTIAKRHPTSIDTTAGREPSRATGGWPAQCPLIRRRPQPRCRPHHAKLGSGSGRTTRTPNKLVRKAHEDEHNGRKRRSGKPFQARLRSTSCRSRAARSPPVDVPSPVSVTCVRFPPSVCGCLTSTCYREGGALACVEEPDACVESGLTCHKPGRGFARWYRQLGRSIAVRFILVPQYLFLDRDGNEVGVLRSESTEWEVGSVVERASGMYRVTEVVVPMFEDIHGMVAYVIVERLATDPLPPTTTAEHA